MKKSAFFLVLTLVLTGCGQTTTTTEEPAAVEEAAPAAEAPAEAPADPAAEALQELPTVPIQAPPGPVQPTSSETEDSSSDPTPAPTH